MILKEVSIPSFKTRVLKTNLVLSIHFPLYMLASILGRNYYLFIAFFIWYIINFFIGLKQNANKFIYKIGSREDKIVFYGVKGNKNIAFLEEYELSHLKIEIEEYSTLKIKKTEIKFLYKRKIVIRQNNIVWQIGDFEELKLLIDKMRLEN